MPRWLMTHGIRVPLPLGVVSFLSRIPPAQESVSYHDAFKVNCAENAFLTQYRNQNSPPAADHQLSPLSSCRPRVCPRYIARASGRSQYSGTNKDCFRSLQTAREMGTWGGGGAESPCRPMMKALATSLPTTSSTFPSRVTMVPPPG